MLNINAEIDEMDEKVVKKAKKILESVSLFKHPKAENLLFLKKDYNVSNEIFLYTIQNYNYAQLVNHVTKYYLYLGYKEVGVKNNVYIKTAEQMEEIEAMIELAMAKIIAEERGKCDGNIFDQDRGNGLPRNHESQLPGENSCPQI